MRKISFLLIIAVATLLQTGCESDDPTFDTESPASIEIDNTEITLDDNNTYTLTFKSSHDWEIFLSDVPEDNWCSVSPAKGKAGEASVTIAGQPDDSFDDRSMNFVIKAGDAEATVRVIQKGKSVVDAEHINIPDEAFRQYCLENFDTDGNGAISVVEAQAVLQIDIHGTEIKSLEGIEYFTSLTYLSCNTTSLTTIDLKHNANIDYVTCTDNSLLTAINLSGRTKLSYIQCQYNPLLTDIDITGCTELMMIDCLYNQQLSKLDVSTNTELTNLNCFDNKITSLDLSKNTKLAILNCSTNALESIDVSNNTELIDFDCGDNLLTNIDISKNTKLTNLSCDNNLLTTLDTSKNTDLTVLYCPYNINLTGLNVYKNKKLEELYCNHNPGLTTLDVSVNLQLTKLDCGSCSNLTELWLNLVGQNISNFNKDSHTEIKYKIVIIQP